jgi:hypothetical protein
MRIRWMAAVVAAVVMLLPQPAEAGGSWLDTDRQYYSVGDHVVARGTFGTGSLEGTVSDGPFYAYLTPGDRAWDDLPTEGAIDLGPMTVTEATGRYCCWVARVEFIVPDVPSGRYWIDYCNDPCTIDGIGDLIGGMIFVGETEREARLAAHLERAKARVDRMQERLDEAAADIATLESRAEAVSTDEPPDVSVAPQTKPPARVDRPVIGIEGAALMAGALLALAAAVLLRRRGSKPPSARNDSVLGRAKGLFAEVEGLSDHETVAGPLDSEAPVAGRRVPSLR